ncbi:MAG TPA: NAD(+) diphosphatase [Pyrinomonadaceae bacterium]|jgi:NAD+ diphosphatase
MFRGRDLLVGEGLTIPRGTSPEVFGLSPLRVQFVGCLEGERCFSAELAPDAEHPAGTRFVNLRQLYGRLPEPLTGVAARAVQLVEWDRTHQFCGACAAPTEYHTKARARVCTNPACGLEFFPRLAPAVIVAVERGPEILLARSPHFTPGRYSVLAGFVEPGESVEGAVHREVLEETGVRVRNLRYYGSQAWPFPNALMLGFQAEYDGGEVTPDGDEIEDAAFFHAERLPETAPGRESISQWLLHDFMWRHGRVPPLH